MTSSTPYLTLLDLILSKPIGCELEQFAVDTVGFSLAARPTAFWLVAAMANWVAVAAGDQSERFLFWWNEVSSDEVVWSAVSNHRRQSRQ